MAEDLKGLLGRRLREARKRLGLTQKELAARVEGKVDYTYIGRIERGDQFPSIKMLQKIGRALSLPISYFFEEEDGKVREVLLSSYLEGLIREEKGRQLIDLLSRLHPEDLSFLTEIAKLLARQRRPASPTLKVAEPEGTYGDVRRIIREIEGLMAKEGRREVRERLKRVIAELEGIRPS